MDDKHIKQAENWRDKLLKGSRTLGIAVISTKDRDGNQIDAYPEVGHAPFVHLDGRFYIYASHLSAHVRAMIENQPVLFFLVADETHSQNIWARVRLKFSAEIKQLSRDDGKFSLILDEIGAQHGPVMDMIRNFSDFHLFEITPQKGVLVTGFAAAFDVAGPEFTLIRHLRQG